MSRAPVPGKTKTRLIPALGEQGASALHTRLLDNLLSRLTYTELATITLCCTPDMTHPFFQACQKKYGIGLKQQRGSDLGERMFNALGDSLAVHRYAIVVGSDIPALSANDINDAIKAMEAGCKAVISPAEDGGYGLIGLSCIERRLFEGIDWGTDRVLAQTEKRLKELGWRWARLRTLWDVDTPQDLERLESG